ncbi:MAG TPA: preprotein translocase subunit SecE [Gemmataceae bacterium]|jgi:preprotein translocase SecE subunit|nr:preprotein translocase subunit SecE [Gemmataceae bacterium]
MAVAEKKPPDSQTRTPAGNLTVASLAGAIYVLGGLALVFQGVPWLWKTGVAPWLGESLPFVNTAGLITVMVFAAVALFVFGLTLVGPNPPAGLRAGIFTVIVGVALVALLSAWIGGLLERWILTSPDAAMAGLGLTAAIGAGLLFFAWRMFTKYLTPKNLEAFEEQGWFSSLRYKPMQGQRVRRATMLGLLVLLGCGVWVLVQHGTLVTGAADWALRIPFTNRAIPLLPDVAITAPLLLAVAAFWFSFRVVNWPTFADFLIATEAEVNKVSWPTRRSVIQDTIVVLSTVVLMTLFLFAVDIAWGKLLSWGPIGVLRTLDTSNAPDAQKSARPQDQGEW